jgi:putative hemolysin
MIPGYLVLIFLAMLGHAFFSGMETGLISINRLRLRHLAEEGLPWAVRLQSLIEQPAALLGTTLLGTNFFMTVASVLAAAIGQRLHEASGETIAGALMAILVLLFCEFIPKSWFRAQPLGRCPPLLPLFLAAQRLLRPFVRLVIGVTDWIIQDPEQSVRRAPLVTRDDLLHLTARSAEAGSLSPRQRLMLLRVAELSKIPCSAVMTPRRRMQTLSADAPVSLFFQESTRTGFASYPVMNPAGTECVGVVNLFELMPLEPPESQTPLARLMKPPQFIRDDRPVLDVFPLLRRTRQSLCLVQSPSGEVVGLLTVEDILRRILGGS